jgi:hypothetical protein
LRDVVLLLLQMAMLLCLMLWVALLHWRLA